MKTKNLSKAMMLLFFLALSSQISAQNVLMQDNGNGNYTFISTFPKADLHFYLFGDGYHSFEHSPNHQYHSNNVPALVDLFRTGPYEDEHPDGLLAGSPTEGVSSPSIPQYAFNNKVELKKSWNLVPDKEHYYILMFENNDAVPLNGQVEFHFDTVEIAVDEAGILDHYNSWVSNRTLESSEYFSEGYNKKYVWQFTGLESEEQRFIYVPAECLSSRMNKVAVRAVIKYDGVQAPEYNPSSDGSLDHINNSNYFTLTERVRGYPHDPNCIVTNPYALTTIDEDQTVLYTLFFHNEGTALAEDVTLDFFIDEPAFDISFVSSSDHCIVQPVPNAPYGIQDVQILFPAIHLPGMGQIPAPNYYSTIGWVTLRVCLNPTGWQRAFAYSDVDIYFDDQPAVVAEHHIFRLINHSLNANCTSSLNQIMAKESSNAVELGDISVYPNPTQSTAIIELSENFKDGTKVALYDSAGKLLWNGTFRSWRKVLDLSAFDNGVYILVLEDKFGNKTTKSILKL